MKVQITRMTSKDGFPEPTEVLGTFDMDAPPREDERITIVTEDGGQRMFLVDRIVHQFHTVRGFDATLVEVWEA